MIGLLKENEKREREGEKEGGGGVEKREREWRGGGTEKKRGTHKCISSRKEQQHDFYSRYLMSLYLRRTWQREREWNKKEKEKMGKTNQQQQQIERDLGTWINNFPSKNDFATFQLPVCKFKKYDSSESRGTWWLTNVTFNHSASTSLIIPSMKLATNVVKTNYLLPWPPQLISSSEN